MGSKAFLLQQLDKLFQGKILLVLEENEFAELVLSAVPNLLIAAEEFEEEGRFGDAKMARRLAKELDRAPVTAPAVVSTNQFIN